MYMGKGLHVYHTYRISRLFYILFLSLCRDLKTPSDREGRGIDISRRWVVSVEIVLQGVAF